ncbi:unnamed protein product [Zymoseptoria tritici ST99CH_1A5]|uniref:Uncharacterized protein n=4 Tax=Zymoseptoria tritici TaxID=1047171 RepID=F9X7X2_ZYMTI|nr:uncharacterized protein MYCGRDRAFT_80097 [Zymoseptoria tritici IPO323]SMQ49119.1 unnamed protein product [Zymoseptoria tritici ST99CH_3D7]SMR48936.1 unnamed protein product [Zymoseptoria tritici ST99CH_1E4]SMR50122.1 unnamed protein product [Zymoseptoria tritici ST99CH_3D1]SMY22822.1 unnamed protein product [Zymoseptoria tritici ST99CH_1A5]EGP88951.1 hypothetical protein MYCGRDRAFT_80097 [Zymoseptoria tritici IPO323]
MRPSMIHRMAFPKFPGLYRRNNVPDWQKLHQAHDGVRQWDKGPRAKYMLYPYYACLIATTAATQYMMVRMVLGKKTWFGGATAAKE